VSAERVALIELLFLQELQASYSRRKQRRDCAIRREPAAVAEAAEMKAELERRLPAAWAAARAAIAQGPANRITGAQATPARENTPKEGWPSYPGDCRFVVAKGAGPGIWNRWARICGGQRYHHAPNWRYAS
jgi:hypothetical protein